LKINRNDGVGAGFPRPRPRPTPLGAEYLPLNLQTTVDAQ